MTQRLRNSVLVLAFVIAALQTLLGQSQARVNPSYTPSSILSSDLGNDVPPRRLNVRFPWRDPEQVAAEIHTLLFEQDTVLANRDLNLAVPAITPEIQTLADGLENDPLAIYDYVHNHIDFVPSWGLLKNPRETLLAGAGNPFDQAQLLAALLEAAGYQTRFVWGNIRVTKTAAMNWVGSQNASTVGNIFASGGIPTVDEGDTLRLTHIWVELLDAGAWHGLDPSFKSYNERSGQGLGPLLDYQLSTFLNRAASGASITTNYVQYLNSANIRTDLEGFARNLIGELRSGDTFISPESLIGSRDIAPVASAGYPPLPYTVVSTAGSASAIPDSFAYALTIQLPGIAYTTFVDDIAGERITIFYECATPIDCELLELGGGVYTILPAYQINVVPQLRIGGQVVATGSAVPLGSWGHPLNVTLATPISGWSPSFSQSLTAGEWYALPMRLQTVSNRALSRQVDLLNAALAQGLDPDDERVLGQILNVLGLSYFNEVDLGDRIDGRLAQIVHVPHFSMMIASRNLIIWVDAALNPVDLDPAGHTVDVRLSIDSAISAQNPANPERERAWFVSAGLRGSAVEHAIVEQVQPVPAVSTIQLLREAIEGGQRIYYITPANWAAVNSSLGHPVYVLNAIVDALNSGEHVIISQNPVTYGQWQGAGWIALDPDSGSAGYLIAGSIIPTAHQAAVVISGGSSAIPQPPGDSRKLAGPVNTQLYANLEQIDRAPTEATKQALERVVQPPPDPPTRDDPGMAAPIGDPLNAPTGAFQVRQADLAPLGGLGPSLEFERFYLSSRSNLSSTLGFGWSHTYNTAFLTSTAWMRGFGSRTALEAAPALAAAQLGLDLFDTSSIPHQRFAIDVVLTHWLMDQITDNAATLREPDGSVSAYVRLLDGAYQEPAGRRRLKQVTIAGDGAATLDWEDGRRSHFNAAGRPTALEDASGHTTSLGYGPAGELESVTDAVGRVLSFSHNPQGRLSQVTDPAGRTFRYAYDGQGNLQTYTDPAGGVTTYGYDGGHRLTTVTDPLGANFVANQYNGLGQVEAQTNGRGNTLNLLFGGDHTTLIDPLGQRTVYAYDERGRVQAMRDPLGHRVSATYDAADHLLTRTDGLGQTTTFAYDGYGRLLTTTDPLGFATTWHHDAAGNPIRYVDKRGQTWQFSFDGDHNLTAVADPLGNTAAYTYNNGRLVHAQNDAGVSADYGYDVHGNLTCTTNAFGTGCWRYDAVGQPVGYTDAASNAYLVSFDLLGNLLQITDPLGNATRFSYDANGNVVGYTDANGNTATYVYDAQFNLTRVTDPLGGSTVYDYDANDRLLRVTDPLGRQTSYQYDAAGRFATLTDPLGRVVTYTYDAADRLVGFGRADGSNVGYQRDALGRLIGVDYPSSPDITYTYDAAGNLTGALYGGAWSANYVYDGASRLVEIEDETRNLLTTLAYDAAGRRTRLLVQQDAATLYDLLYAYDAASRLTRLTDQLGAPAQTLQFGHDAAGRLTGVTYPGGVQSDYEHDLAGRVTQVSHQDDQGDSIATHRYAYDAVGNITAVDENTPLQAFQTTYTYDALDRLIGETTPGYTIAYAYDAAGNLTRRTDPQGIRDLTYDAADQLLSYGSESFGYDVHGNLVTWRNAAGTHTLVYDDENLMTRLSLPDGTSFSMARDAFGRHLSLQGPNSDQGIVYDGLNLLLTGNLDLSQSTARYLYGNDLLLARYTDRLGFTTYLADALDNVRYLVSAGGEPFDGYHYQGYGAHVQAGVDPNPYRFDGRLGVRSVGAPSLPLLAMGYRDASLLGRFLTRDPLPGNLVWPSTLNDYPFALGDPIGNSDRTGLRDDDRFVPLTKANDPHALATADRTGQAPPRHGTGLGEPHDPMAASIGSAGNVVLEFPLELKLLLAGLPKRRAASPIRPESLPVETGGVPADRYAAAGAAGAPLEPTRWLPVAAHGTTFALACSADDRLLAGAFHAGLFESLDLPHAVWDSVHAAAVGEIAVVDSSTAYAGAWNGGVLKSSDGGATWVPSSAGLTANHVQALAADPANANQLYAGTEVGLFVSANAGAAWSRAPGALPGVSVSELAFAGDTLLAVTEFGLYRSPNGGSTWVTPTVGLPAGRVNSLLPGAAPGAVYAGTDRGAYTSADGGDTWAVWGAGLADRDVRVLAIDPADGNHAVAGTTSGLFVSANGGDDWVASTYPGFEGIASQVGALAFCPGGGEANLYLGAGGGVYALRTPVAPLGVTIAGSLSVTVGTNATFTATVVPGTTTLPLDYVWEATGQPTSYKSGVYMTATTETFAWNQTGAQALTVTVSNTLGWANNTYTVNVIAADETLIYLPVLLRQ